MGTFTAIIQKDEDMYVAKCPEIGTVSQGHFSERMGILDPNFVARDVLPQTVSSFNCKPFLIAASPWKPMHPMCFGHKCCSTWICSNLPFRRDRKCQQKTSRELQNQKKEKLVLWKTRSCLFGEIQRWVQQVESLLWRRWRDWSWNQHMFLYWCRRNVRINRKPPLARSKR